MGTTPLKLWKKCSRNLTILHISNRASWRKDRTVMFQLYQCLTCSHLNYESFFYTFSSTKCLTIIDPICHSGMHLSTSAFQMTQMGSRCMESGEPTLAIHWQMLLCNYTIKLCAVKKYPSYGIIHWPTVQVRFALNIKASSPADFRYKELLTTFHTTTPSIITFKNSRSTTLGHNQIMLGYLPMWLYKGI
jgi:hypothetical protein